MGDIDLLEVPPADRTRSLEYKADPSLSGRVSVRGFRLLLALTLLNTTLLGASVMGPQLFPFLRGQWTQWQANRTAARALEQSRQAAATVRRQCSTYSLPADAVVYEEDPAEATRLLRDGGVTYQRATPIEQRAPRGWVPPMKRVSPPFFAAIRNGSRAVSPAALDAPLLFLHERTAPGGMKHIVAVQLATRIDWRTDTTTDDNTRRMRINYSQQKTRHLVASAWPAPDPPTLGLPPEIKRDYRLQLPDTFDRPAAQWLPGPGSEAVVPPVDYGNVLRIFAGQPDAKDPSRFTIAYRLDGRAGVIDGQLKDDGIELRARDGEWKFDNGEVLRLDAPATQPTVYPAESKRE